MLLGGGWGSEVVRHTSEINCSKGSCRKHERAPRSAVVGRVGMIMVEKEKEKKERSILEKEKKGRSILEKEKKERSILEKEKEKKGTKCVDCPRGSVVL